MSLIRTSLIAIFAVFCVAGGISYAQESEMSAEEVAGMEAWKKAMTPGSEHAKLAEMAGEFKITVRTFQAPGVEPMISTGTASRKVIMGGRHLEEVIQSSFMGEAFTGRGVMGFNNVTGTWWSTWVDNMSTGVSIADGEWDWAERQGVFYGEYIDPLTKEIQETKAVITLLEGGDERMEMYMMTSTGSFKSMEILYERR
jgi:hypothetical protein